MGELEKEFKAYREKMNARILSADSVGIRRFFNLDHQAYQPGALDKKTKEFMGLSASMVLRCDDCIRYHISECLAAGATENEILEAFEVSLVVGGSILIPHLRRAFEYLDDCTSAGTELSQDEKKNHSAIHSQHSENL